MFILDAIYKYVHAYLIQLCLTLCDPMDCSPPGSSVQGYSRQDFWSGLPCSPLGDLPTQRSNLYLLHCRWILYPLSHLGSPFISDNIHTVFVIFCLTFSLGIMPSMSIHVFANGKIVFLLWLSCIPGCVCVCVHAQTPQLLYPLIC